MGNSTNLGACRKSKLYGGAARGGASFKIHD